MVLKTVGAKDAFYIFTEAQYITHVILFLFFAYFPKPFHKPTMLCEAKKVGFGCAI